MMTITNNEKQQQLLSASDDIELKELNDKSEGK